MTTQTEIGRYRLVRHLATGGMGEVFLAEAPGAAGFAKRVVVKTLREELAADQDLVRQFIAEGQLLEALDHPNIAAILDLGQDGEQYFLAMEFVEGFDLRALLRALPHNSEERQVLGEDAVLALIAAVAHALDHAQTRRGLDGKALGIVHHDVTPSNVMVRRDGHVKLVDFGVARTALVARLSPGALRGKLPYLSPEHARQERADGRSDLFSLGLCACEWLTGQRALEVGEPDLLGEAYEQLPERLAVCADRVSPETLALLTHLTRLDPRERPRTAAEVAERAQRILADHGELSPTRHLAAELAPAFDVLAARAGSFDQTLSQTLGLLGNPGVDFTGTLSLPGIEVVQQASQSARAAKDSGLSQAADARRAGSLRWPHVAGAVAFALLLWVAWPRTDGDHPMPVELALGAPAPGISRPEPALPQVLPTPATPVAALVPAPAAATGPVPEPPPTAKETAESRERVPRDPGRDLVAREPTGKETARVAAAATATVEFRVLPAATLVTVDGKPRQATDGGSHYVLQLRPGKHTIRATDPDGEQPAQSVEVDLLAGDHERLKGFSFLP